MGRWCLRTGLVVLPVLWLAGCKGPPANEGYPNDPLLVSMKPVVGKADASAPTAFAHREPKLPPLPTDTQVVQAAHTGLSPANQSHANNVN